MRIRAYKLWRLFGATALVLSSAAASAQIPSSPPASAGQSLQLPVRGELTRSAPRPADRAVLNRTPRSATPSVPRARSAALVSPIDSAWTAYQSQLAKFPKDVSPTSNETKSAGVKPSVPWWASQDGQPTPIGNGRASKPMEKEKINPSPAMIAEPKSSPAPERSQTQEHARPPIVRLAGSEATQGRAPSNVFGIVVLSIITVLALALKVISLRRRKVRIKPDFRQEPIVDQSPAERRTPSDANKFFIQPVAETSNARADGDVAWIPFARAVNVGRWKIAGPAYVGSRLPTSNQTSDHDNCLIDPSQPVGGSADISGQHMNYWPSYASMDPGSRLAFLDWMASDRSSPDTYIGYVFLYFYALERRAILERSEGDRAAIERELLRLLGIYGDNRSFQRYGTELLSTLQLLDIGGGRDPLPAYEPAGGDIPASVKVAIGRRLRDQLPIEPEWLLSWTMSHPDTKVRTPARRAFSQLQGMFDEECRRRFPNGLVLDGRRLAPARILYRSASGTFVSNLTDILGALPDVSNCSEALALGRNLLDDCTERLEEYSRFVAKAPELAASLHAIALLPRTQRALALEALPSDPLQWMRERARAQDLVPEGRLFDLVNSVQPGKVTPTKLRELAETLAKFGFGFIPDPSFSFGSGDGTMLLFELEQPAETVEAASPYYRTALLTLALGMLVGKADGSLQPAERLSLEAMATNADGITADERRRLHTDLRWLELHPIALAGLRKKLATIPHGERGRIADLLVDVASAGGSQQPTEVAILERIYRQLDLDPERLYSGLHKASGAAPLDEPVRVPGDGQPSGYAIPQAPKPSAGRADPPRVHAVPTPAPPVDRRAEIRAETEEAAVLLAGVFGADESEELPEVAAEPQVRALEPRLATLLQALLERESWPRADFERLTREVSLMPGAVLEDLNSWAFEKYDDLLLEGDDPIVVNRDIATGQFSEAAE